MIRRAAVALAVLGFVGSCRKTGGTPATPPTPPAHIAGPAADAEPTGLDAEVPAAILPNAPELAWWRSSMTTREERLAWWRQARFGMFVHWGVYSGLGGSWEGQPVRGYAEHIQRIRRIPHARYLSEVAGKFAPAAFDAEAWIAAAKAAGMGYFVITAKHHDGFAMYDSAVSDFNVVKATPWRKDPMRELAAAARRQGVKFGFYYSHAFDWGEADGVGNDWEHENPGGDRNLHGGRDWWLHTPAFLPKVRRYVDTKAIPQLRELIAQYDPDILWFDTPHKLPPEENLRILAAVRAAKPDIVINGRIVQPFPGAPPARFGDYASTADRPAEFPPQPGDWEAIPTTNESYGFHAMDHSHKSVGFFVALLAKAAARGGNVLLNIGPRGDGQIDAPDAAILRGLAAWMAVNRESIAGTTRTPLPVQAWGESTRKGNTLYLHVFKWPQDGRLRVGGLKSPVTSAYLLADAKRAPLRTERTGALDLIVRVPNRAPDANNSVVALSFDRAPEIDPVRLLSTAVDRDELRAFDGEISQDLRFGAGKVRDAWVHGWRQTGATVRWPVRLAAPARFAVAISYDADAASTGGRYAVKLGEQTLTGAVAKTPGAPVKLGEVSLPAGATSIEVRGLAIQGEELFRLRGLELTPIRSDN